MFSEERSVYSSIRGLGAGKMKAVAQWLKRNRALLSSCLEVLLFCSGNNLVFSPKRGNLYGQEGVLVELNRHEGIPLYFYAKKGNSKKSYDVVYCRLFIPVRFLGVPLFGAKIGRYTPFWRSPFYLITLQLFFLRQALDEDTC